MKNKKNKQQQSKLTTLGQSLVQYHNIEGEINGKHFTILNDTMDSRLEKVLLSRLQNIKKTIATATTTYTTITSRNNNTTSSSGSSSSSSSTVSTSSNTTIIKDYGEKRLHQLRYLHIPRTGITFVTTVVHFCCEHLEDIVIDVKARYDLQPWKVDPTCRICLKQPISANGDYWSFYPFLDKYDYGQAMALFRSPLPRIASQIVEMRSMRGMMVSLGISPADATIFTQLTLNKFTTNYTSFLSLLEQKSEIVKIGRDSQHQLLYDDFLQVAKRCYDQIYGLQVRNQSIIEECRWQMAARYPGIRGCQTRMVLGKNCIDSYQLTTADLDRAKARLKDGFAFIGLTEKWNESVHLFHQKFGGKLFGEELQRPTKKTFIKLKLRVRAWLVKGNYEDPWDDDLYHYAEELFLDHLVVPS
eukprot:scaffold5626_cov258-Ochromonas_danica.AAC.7